MPRPHTACFSQESLRDHASLSPFSGHRTARTRLGAVLSVYSPDELALSMTLVRTIRPQHAQEPPASQEVQKQLVASRMRVYIRITARLSVISITLHKRKSTQHGSELPRCSTLALSRTFARGTSPRCPDVVRDSTSSARPRPHPHPHNARARVYGSTGWRPITCSPRACVNVLSVLIVSPSFTKPIREDGFRHLPGCVPAYASIV